MDTWHQLQAKRDQEAAAQLQELGQLDAQVSAAAAQEQDMGAQLAAAQRQAVKGTRIGPHGTTFRQVATAGF